MNRTKFLTIIIIALLLLNLGTLGYLFMRGGKGGPPPHHQKGGPSAFIIKKLKFTPEQEGNFIELRNAHRRAMNQLGDSLRDLQEIYFDGLKTSTVDTAAATRYATEIAHLEARTHQVTFNHFVEVRKLCTPEQQKLFDEFITDIIHSMSPPPPGAGSPPRGGGGDRSVIPAKAGILLPINSFLIMRFRNKFGMTGSGSAQPATTSLN